MTNLSKYLFLDADKGRRGDSWPSLIFVYLYIMRGGAIYAVSLSHSELMIQAADMYASFSFFCDVGVLCVWVCLGGKQS